MPENVISDPLNEVRICALPDMRMLCSVIQDEEGKDIDDMGDGLNRWADARGLSHLPGMREEFAYWDMKKGLFVFLLRIPNDFPNDGPYPEVLIKGGLEAVVSGEREHLVPRYNALQRWIAESDRYAADERHDAWVDWLTPAAVNKAYDFEQQDIFMSIRLKHE